jgi:hypothetical protein
MVVRQDETYLRTLVDGAIRSLLEDGTITELIDRHDLPGEAPPLE